MTHIVYKTTNLINGKFYIGVHSGDNSNYLGSGIGIKRAIKKYGKKNFKRDILYSFDTKKEAYDKERLLVDKFLIGQHNCYNVCVGGVIGGLEKPIRRIDSVLLEIVTYESVGKAAKEVGGHSGCISTVANFIDALPQYRSKTGYGYYWSFIDKEFPPMYYIVSIDEKNNKTKYRTIREAAKLIDCDWKTLTAIAKKNLILNGQFWGKVKVKPELLKNVS